MILPHIVFIKNEKPGQMILLTFSINKQNLDLFRFMKEYGFYC